MRRSQGAISQYIPNSPPPTYFLNQTYHSSMIAVSQFQSIRVIFCENSLLIELIGEPNTTTGTNRIQSQVITQLIRRNRGFNIRAINWTRKRPITFVFGTLAV